ncbi:PKD domain-containing protein [Actinotalea sp. BY-33]|uniref:PKD domain-containing protein n=1 Tax=Actinotalea soli TaxID=2819234 RepID=A0A939LR32_9CELL|nr:PKD domain-containing protein [Actinotalea soli]MBO1752458.1 PKD domain-containing protein [Actinotalea soli]
MRQTITTGGLALLLTASLIPSSAVQAVVRASGGGWWDAEAVDDSVVVGRHERQDSSTGSAATDRPSASGAPAPEYRRIPIGFCIAEDWMDGTQACLGDDGATYITPECEDGSDYLQPLFTRPVDSSGAASGEWEQVDEGGCAEDAAAAQVVVLTAEQFRRLPLQASAPAFQPADGRGLVGKDLILMTSAEPQTLTTDVLGVPVTVRATPVEFTWDLGDGSAPLTTTDAGRPYPDHTVAQAYAREGRYAVTLTTTWQGEYQLAGAGVWLPVAGTATTTSAPFPTEAVSARSQLVADPLN